MNYLSAIGFQVADLEAYQALAEMVFDRGATFPVGDNFYLRYHDASGAELWLQVDLLHSFVGMNAHFEVRSSIKVKLLEAINRHEGTMDGGFLAEMQTGGIRFRFDLPDAHMLPSMRLPALATLHLAAFSDQPAAISKSGSFSFLPAEQDANTLITAEIFETRLLKNEYSGKPFRWIKLHAPGGAIEALLPATVDDALCIPGNWISGEFRLCGRVEVDPQEQVPAKFLERLFWGG